MVSIFLKSFRGLLNSINGKFKGLRNSADQFGKCLIRDFGLLATLEASKNCLKLNTVELKALDLGMNRRTALTLGDSSSDSGHLFKWCTWLTLIEYQQKAPMEGGPVPLSKTSLSTRGWGPSWHISLI